MQWAKRIGLFLLTNILVIITINIVLRVLGVGSYINQYGLDYSNLMVFCFIWGMVGSFVSLFLSKFMAKMFYGVQIIPSNDTRFASLVSRVHQLSRAAGLSKMPEVGIYQSSELNAFATGPSRSNSLVAVSTGLLDHMNDDEVEGVLAHEVSHIANGDMVTMTLVQGVVNAFALFLAKVAAFAISNLGRDEDESPSYGWGTFFIEQAFYMFFSFLGMFVVAFVSRAREYRADAGAAQIAGRDKMIAALRKLERTMGMMDNSEQNTAIQAMKISSKSNILALLSTHPPLSERIKALGG
jgi:heat shock protein HtpX